MLPKKYAECYIHIILDVIAVLSFTIVYRLTVSYNARYHNNGSLNTSQIIPIASIGPIALYIGQNIIDLWQKALT